MKSRLRSLDVKGVISRLLVLASMAMLSLAPSVQVNAMPSADACWVNELYFHCGIEHDECTGDAMIDVGYSSAGLCRQDIDGSLYCMWTNAYYDNTDRDCGYGDYVGSTPSLGDLVFFVGQARNNHHYGSQVVEHVFKHRLKVWEFPDQTCDNKQYFTRTSTDEATYVMPAGTHQQQCNSDSKLDCSGGYGDPIACHRPDVLFSDPQEVGAGSYAYLYQVYTEKCEITGANCKVAEDWGCVEMWRN